MIKVSLLIQSNLSDVLIEMGPHSNQAQERIRFVKWLIATYPDTTTRVDEDEVFEKYKSFNPQSRL